ncbi:MAG: FtsX-like permease family protein [Saprospiraceae bacterium]
MFQNYLTVAFRNFSRNKIFTAINVVGLAFGIASALLVYLLVNEQLSYDTFHQKAGRTYRVVTHLYFENESKTAGAPCPLSQALREEVPQIEKVGEFYHLDNILLSTEINGEWKKLKYDDLDGSYVSPEIFEIFDFKWIAGNPASFSQPNKIALRQKQAKALFGDSDPMGKMVKVNNEVDATVVGILADGPENSDFYKAAYISQASYAALHKDRMEAWYSVGSGNQIILTLPEGTDLQNVNAQLTALADKYHPDEKGKGPNGGNTYNHVVQPLADVHFNPDYDGQVEKSLMWALSLVGLFLIFTACINFVNLATAQALGRSKEVGIRKVVGGNRSQLFGQFMMETGAIVFLAIVLAAAIINPILPVVREMTMSNISFNLLENSNLWFFLLAVFFGVTLLSGTYPALVLAGFKPVSAIKGKITTQTLGGFNVRRALVVAQFAISQLLIIGVAVMSMQTNFLKNMDLGYNKEAIVVVNLPKGSDQNFHTLENQLRGVKGVEQLSFSQTTATSNNQNYSHFTFDNREKVEEWQMLIRPADSHFLDTYGLSLVAGSRLPESDSVRGFLVNEAFVEKIGLGSPEEAIGKSFSTWGEKAPIVGVLKNFYANPAGRSGFEPMCMMAMPSSFRTVNLKVSTANVPETLAGVEKVWTGLFPQDFYDYQFFDERVEKFYRLESILLGLIRTFCGVALFIGCLGLFGLVTFLIARRRKEIGVRKVLGASDVSILGLFGKEFVRLVLIAFAIAAPLGYFAMSAFLAGYQNAIQLGFGTFLFAIAVSVGIAALTVGWHSWLAARANPVESLRSE